MLFPAVPSAALLVLFPGAADALFSTARDGANEAFGVVGALCAAVVVALTIGLTAAATAYVALRPSPPPSDGASSAEGKEKEEGALSAEGKEKEIAIDAGSHDEYVHSNAAPDERPSFLSSLLAPKPSHCLSPHAERAWGAATLFAALPRNTPSSSPPRSCASTLR